MLVGVGWEDNQVCRVVDDRKGREAVAGPKLATPTRSDGVHLFVGQQLLNLFFISIYILTYPTGGRATVGLRCWRASDDLGAGRSASAVVDTKGPCTGRVGLIAHTLGTGDGPFLGSGHHGHGVGSLGLRGRCEGSGREDGGDEDVGELHLCVCVCESWREMELERKKRLRDQ